jgi:D-lactate dehydrogenase
MKVTIFSTKEFEKKYLLTSNNEKHQIIFKEEPLSVQTADLAKGSDAVSIFANDDASAPVLDKLQKLGINYIAIRAAGYDQVDVPHAKKLGFRMANVPEYSPYAIAEHAVALMLAMNRKIVRADKKVKSFNFSLDDLIGFDMNGKTAGIIGLGKIGGIVAKILNGFGCKILGYDIYKNEDLIKNYGVEYCSMDELASRSDIITIHAPLNEKSKYLINKTLINKMKTGVMLINTGRGAILNTRDVIDGLVSGKIGYLGLDVYENEKGLFFYDHSDEVPKDEMLKRLYSFHNVLVTGHQAFLTETALNNISDITINNLNCWEKTQASPSEL